MAAVSEFTLEPDNQAAWSNFAGPVEAHFRFMEKRLGVTIGSRAQTLRISGKKDDVHIAETVLRGLWRDAQNEPLDTDQIHLATSVLEDKVKQANDAEYAPQDVAIKAKRGTIRGRGDNQAKYLHAIATHDINFGIGPAGTGKTFLAVASAVDAMNEGRVQRLVLVRPAVEAGEKLGFLPGDLSQKVDPYLRPLYDALYEMFGVEKTLKLLEKNVIEIAPLAYMRGRTLNDAFVILDEAQNTTVEQMKMFLTRIGYGSTAVVTGDLTQTDLPRHQKSGLRDALEVLEGVNGISFTFFEAKDVVRHPLVARIVNAYDARDRASHREPGDD